MYVDESDKWNSELQKFACTAPLLTACPSQDCRDGEMPSAARDAVSVLSHLRSLKLPYSAVASDVVAQFLALPKLEHLDCLLCEPLFQRKGLVKTSSLRDLRLRNPSPVAIVSSFIFHLRASRLSAIDLDVCCQRGEHADILALFRHLNNATTTKSLQELEIRVTTSSMEDPDESLPSHALRDILLPIFSHKYVRNLVLTIPDVYIATFTDDDLFAILESWSHLEKLHVSLPYQQSQSFPDIAALEHVARHYPRLTTLEIPMDILNEPALPINPPLTSHPLAALAIEIRQFEPHVRSDRIAHYIDTLFPDLNSGDCREESFSGNILWEHQVRWLDMWRKLKELREERLGDSDSWWDA